MERDNNPFPNIDLFPHLHKAARFLVRAVTFLPEGGYPSEYPKHPERRGAEAMLSTLMEQSNGGQQQPEL